jgi:hypothetical protein
MPCQRGIKLVRSGAVQNNRWCEKGIKRRSGKKQNEKSFESIIANVGHAGDAANSL